MRKFNGYAAEAVKRGIKIYHLNIGQPDIITPDAYFQAMREFSEPVLAYTPSRGLPVLLDAVRGYYGNIGVELKDENILVTTGGSDLLFPTGDTEYRETKSLNAHACIKNREDFERYPCPDPDKADYSRLEKVAPYLPGNMKIMASSPDGLLENVINIVGYDNLCLMLYDDPELVRDIFDRVGSILLRHYEISASFDTVGILMINDDWGFNSQPMLSPAQMREYAFPWHKKMVEVAHRHGKPAVLHSCGQLESVMEDIIEDMKFDGKHSYQDNILPVEDAYRRWGGRIAILGGLDVDFLVRSEPEEITARARRMLEMAEEKGGYALGSGNSIPSYIPPEHYFAMLRAAF